MLKVAANLSLPEEAVTQTFAIFGKRGSGKTNGATVIVEEMLKAQLPVVILDPVDAWWGLKSSFDGKQPGLSIYTFGGAHGDLPLESTAGTLMADLVAKERLPCILSMKLWGVAERARFVADFAKRLLQANSDPVMMVLEEADAFIPQRPGKGEEAMLGAMDRLVRWGRQSGIGCTIITQRSAKVNKDVTTQAETLIAFRTTGPQDRDAINNWIKFHAGEEKLDEFQRTIPTLPSGTAWLWSPEWLDCFKQVAFRRRQTYDSAATPKVGEKRPQPKQLAAVDLERLRSQMAETVEKAKADDPKELKKCILQLQKQLASKEADPATIDVAVKKAIEQRDREWAAAIKEHERVNATLKGRLDKIHDLSAVNGDATPGRNLPGKKEGLPSTAKSPEKQAVSTGRISSPNPVSSKPVKTRANYASDYASKDAGAGNLGKAERAILTAFYWLKDEEATPAKIAFYSNYRATSGGFNNALGKLRSAGLLQGWRITFEGAAAIQQMGVDERPSGEELLTWLKAKLSLAERTILDVLVASYPERMTNEQIAAASGYSSGSGGFNNALGRLRTLEAAEGYERDGGVKASDVFFE